MSNGAKVGLGGLYQIRAGFKSLKLTKNPEITYFKFKYINYRNGTNIYFPLNYQPRHFSRRTRY